jgi:cell division protein FtsB
MPVDQKFKKGTSNEATGSLFSSTPGRSHNVGEIYNGDALTPPALSQEVPRQRLRAEFITTGNQRIVQRKVSPFNIVVFLFVGAIGIVLYISNIIAVDQLMNEINALETQYSQILMEQEILKMQINRMTSLERIRGRAEQELGLKTPNEPPVILHIDPERMEEIREAMHQ